MKRHSSLTPLSRDHHRALLLARLLKKDAPVYKGLPTDLKGKAVYALKFFREDLVQHFEEEEQIVIAKIRGVNAVLDQQANEIIREHVALRALFALIENTHELASHLDKLGTALEQHIRKEEREFFPLLQKLCSEKLLSEIEKALPL